jgi:hypothetical protein
MFVQFLLAICALDALILTTQSIALIIGDGRDAH